MNPSTGRTEPTEGQADEGQAEGIAPSVQDAGMVHTAASWSPGKPVREIISALLCQCRHETFLWSLDVLSGLLCNELRLFVHASVSEGAKQTGICFMLKANNRFRLH